MQHLPLWQQLIRNPSPSSSIGPQKHWLTFFFQIYKRFQFSCFLGHENKMSKPMAVLDNLGRMCLRQRGNRCKKPDCVLAKMEVLKKCTAEIQRICLLQEGFIPVLKKILIYLGLTHYQATNFRLFQTGRVCRRQFQI